MCKPASPPETCRVVIAGAGPSGLLLQALLHNRNKSPNARVVYHITMIESRPDLGQLTKEELKVHRSWMIALAGHGLEAVRSCPGLYDEYLADIGILLREGNIYIGSKKMSMGSPAEGDEANTENFIVDRNFIVAGLARYAKDNMQNDDGGGQQFYASKYETEMLYVDSDNHRALIRDKATGAEEYVSYDLLVGADGIRSTAREALAKKHFDFELQVGDIFSLFKAVHIPRPEGVSPAAISILVGALPRFQGICLPETGDAINLSMGVTRNQFEGISDDIKSDDPKVVAKYFKENFKSFKMTDETYTDLATQWCNQRWNRTGMVHCNRYSSVECKILLMGDSAHATSPSIGMGMNTALRDAQKFNELLDEFDDDLAKVLPRYSIDRVPEGNALTDIALNISCFDAKVSARSMLFSTIRTVLNSFVPSLVGPAPFTIVGRPDKTMADVYRIAKEQGDIPKHRAINKRIRQEFFEKEVGLVKCEEEGQGYFSASLFKKAAVVVPVAACAVAIWTKSNQ